MFDFPFSMRGGLWDAWEDMECPIDPWSHWVPPRTSPVDRDSALASWEEVEDPRAPWVGEECFRDP